VALGHAAALAGAGQRQHVPVEVDGQPVGGHQPVDAFGHLPVARVALFPQGREERVHLADPVVGDAVDGGVDHARLVGIVDLAAFERRSRQADPALDADGTRDAHDPAGLEEFPRAGDRVVVDDARRAQPRLPREPRRRRRRVGRERELGVDVVVDVPARDRRGEFALLDLLDQHLQVFQPLRRVQKLQDFRFGASHRIPSVIVPEKAVFPSRIRAFKYCSTFREGIQTI